MNNSLYRILSIALVSIFAATGGLIAETRENQRLHEGKITKNEAQHLVLRKFPGAQVKKCELIQGKDHSNWMVDIIKPGAHEVTKVEVDGLTGKIALPASPKRSVKAG